MLDQIKLYLPAAALLVWALLVVVCGQSDVLSVFGLLLTAACLVIAEATRHKLRAYGDNGWLKHD